MKTPIFILLLLFVCRSQAQVASSCTVPATLRITHDRDARDMALSRMYETHSPDTAFIEVPDRQIDTIMAGLAAIYNLDTALQADSVFKRWCLHTTHGFAYSTISVKVDTNYPWALQWAAMLTTTGYTDLDNFLSIHGFYLTGYFSSSWSADLNNTATLKTTHVLNMQAFADSILLFPGVEYVEIQPNIGSGNLIWYQDSTQTYSFYLGWGDCPAGCTSSKMWKYKVDDACNVTLVSVFKSGDEVYPPLPPQPCGYPTTPPMGVYNSTPLLATINVYPVPATNELHVTNAQCEHMNYVLADMYGRSVMTGTLDSSATISIAGIAPGLYIINLLMPNGQVYRQRIIKN